MQNDRSNSEISSLPVDAIPIDRESGEPIQLQLYRGLTDLILRGVLKPGLKLPATREFAKDLSVSRNTVVRTYEQLQSEGYIETRRGSMTYVANLPSTSPPENLVDDDVPKTMLSEFAYSFDQDERIDFAKNTSALRPNTPDISVFPFKTWNRLLGLKLRQSNLHLLNYNYSYGYPPLQQAISNYLQAYRGVRCEPDQVVVTNGAQSGLDLLTRVLLEPGDVVWMEEPGYVNARLAFSSARSEIRPLRVNESGWALDELPPESPKLIYVTPSSQHPLAITMRIEQRLRLLEVAYRESAWIVEDDYDSEYRNDGRSIPAMQGSDTFQRTIYVGTFAKTLFPAIRLGFIVVPPTLSMRVARAALYTGNQVSLPQQATLSDFIEKGYFAQHLRRTRRLYAARRKKFLELSESLLGQYLEPFNTDVGIQIAFRFKLDVDDKAIAERANELSLNVIPLSRYYHEDPVPGLLLGYAAVDEAVMEKMLSQLAGVLAEFL